ncbi:MAG TPA: DNA replication protein DnaC [Clostridiales bacterium]|jgi:ATPase|nr:DNA replication protein DnaC [Clostridiales bacterium]
MSNDILTSLLSDYEQKKRKAEVNFEHQKVELYKKIPRLHEIEDELNSVAINETKNILLGNSSSLENLHQKIESLKEERKNILSENNLSANDLQPKYECCLCKDTGYIKSGTSATVMCSCLKQKLLNISYNKSNMTNLSKENFENFNPNIFSNEISSNFNISPKQNILNIKQKCIEFVNDFDNPNSKNLLFTGNTGLGKTYMSNCIANELIKKGKNVLYQTAPVLLETIIDNKFNKYKTTNKDNFYKDVLEADLLIIDDLGTECLNSMKLSELFTILNTRILNLNNTVTKTIISTNLNINNIFKSYEERIGSRIVGYYDIYYFFGEDLRFKRK